MTQADSVHSTPPINTSAIDDIPSPTKPREGPQDASIYIPTDVTAEELFRAIGRLRKEARGEIHRLIQFLDDSDNHMELDEAVDDVPCDDRELEPSLCGVTAGAANMPMDGFDEDCEGDGDGGDANDEPSLGSLSSSYDGGDQSRWGFRGEGDIDGEDEHDGREPDDNEGGDGGGSVASEDQTYWVGSGRHDTAMSPAEMEAMRDRYVHSESDRINRDGMHVDTEQGFGLRKRLRNLSDRQKEIVKPRLNRDAVTLT